MRCLVSIDKTYFVLRKNAAGCYPGPEMSSTTDEAQFSSECAFHIRLEILVEAIAKVGNTFYSVASLVAIDGVALEV